MLAVLLRFVLEVELQPELNNARIGGGQDLTEAARVTRNVRRAEIGAIERIEQFGAELEVTPLRQVEVFRKGEVEIDRARPAHDSDARAAKSLRRGIERRLERIGVEPAPERLLRFG